MTVQEQREENRKRMMLNILLLLGADVKFTRESTDAELYDGLAADPDMKAVLEKAELLYRKYRLEGKIELAVRVDEKTIFVEAAKIAVREGLGDAWKITGVDDEKTCCNCKEWIGKVITMSGRDPRYKTYDEFAASHVFHPNCRCSLVPYKVKKVSNKDLDKMAQNSEPITDQFLYTGFVDEQMETESGIGTYDFGETLVMLAPFGVFQGYSEGQAVEEDIDAESVMAMCQRYLEEGAQEILLDVDHRSMRVPEERDTTAAGWIHSLIAVTDLGRMSGLYGKIKWTDVGRQLVETRQYRFISPVFQLADGKPVRLVNAALTNRPALTSISPILNSSPDTAQTDTTKETIDMTKEELVQIIKETFAEMKKDVPEAENAKCENAEPEKQEETKEEPKAEEKPVCENEEPKAEEPKEEPKTEEAPAPEPEKPLEEEKEVIKEEVLNSAPNIGKSVSEDCPWFRMTSV